MNFMICVMTKEFEKHESLSEEVNSWSLPSSAYLLCVAVADAALDPALFRPEMLVPRRGKKKARQRKVHLNAAASLGMLECLQVCGMCGAGRARCRTVLAGCRPG